MKTLRYLLIVAGLVSVLSINAQTLAQQPEAKMHSTSVMMSSGSTLPQAAVTGASVAGSAPAAYAPTKPTGPRRVGENEGTEDEEDPDNPGEPFPIGDGMWPLAICAIAFAFGKWVAKRTKPLR